MGKYTAHLFASAGENGQEAQTVAIDGLLEDAVLAFGGLRRGEIHDERGDRVARVEQRGGRTRVYDPAGDEIHGAW